MNITTIYSAILKQYQISIQNSCSKRACILLSNISIMVKQKVLIYIFAYSNMHMYQKEVVTQELTGNWEDFFKVLSDETRLRILMLLDRRELCVCEICQILALPQPKVSRHLAKMRDLDLVRDKKEGQWTFYYLSIEEPLFKGIMQQLVANSQYHPLVSKDMERLAEKESAGTMCARIRY